MKLRGLILFAYSKGPGWSVGYFDMYL